MVRTVNDADVYGSIQPTDLWCTDKLILARTLGYYCGPAGVAPRPGEYVVRPIMNMRMMSRGATVQYLQGDSIPDGYFWCERFQGRHLSFDYYWGKQALAVEGYREDANRLDRFSRWSRVQDKYILPPQLQLVADRYPHFNIEVIGTHIIEVHYRYNDDFVGHTAPHIIPVWRSDYVASPAGDRLGYIKVNHVRNHM